MTTRWIHLVSGAALLAGICLVLYLSWLGHPQMTRVTWIPRWIAVWADREGTLRTGVPFVFLGLVLARFLTGRHDRLRGWLCAWAGLVVLVLIAEIGQLWLPLRVPSIVDVGWGAAGAAAGLTIGWAVGKSARRLRDSSSPLPHSTGG